MSESQVPAFSDQSRLGARAWIVSSWPQRHRREQRVKLRRVSFLQTYAIRGAELLRQQRHACAYLFIELGHHPLCYLLRDPLHRRWRQVSGRGCLFRFWCRRWLHAKHGGTCEVSEDGVAPAPGSGNSTPPVAVVAPLSVQEDFRCKASHRAQGDGCGQAAHPPLCPRRCTAPRPPHPRPLRAHSSAAAPQ